VRIVLQQTRCPEEDDAIPCVEGDCMADVMEELLKHARTPLFAGATTSRLVSTLLLLNCFAVFGVSNAFANELLQLLHIMLPNDNYLPRSHYEAQKYVVKLGLS
jgi:alkylhydroperoxidase/carboxymuconolactone decarboxylase family protein YurZ